MRITYSVLCLMLSPFIVAHAADAEPIELSLRLSEKGTTQQRMLEILVKNSSNRAIEISSKGFRPEFTVAEWFTWSVDGQAVRYTENIAQIPEAAATKRIPPGEVIVWGEIPLKWLSVKTGKGYDSAIKDDKRHTIKISASAQWKDVKVKPGVLEIGI